MLLDEYSDDVYICLECRCNYCMEGCPVYAETRNEAHAAHGKLTLAMAVLLGLAQYTDNTLSYLAHCALCGYCKHRCGSNRYLGDFYKKVIDPPKIIEAMRADVAKVRGALPAYEKVKLNIEKYQNPFGEPKEDRVNWLKSITSKKSSKKEVKI